MTRPSWDEYFLSIMHVVRTRSTCRGQAGAVIVRDNRILTTGYAGSLAGLDHCDEAGHLLKKVTHEDGTTTEHCLRTVHAEMNAILQAAKMGVSVEKATLYCSMEPCLNCAKAIIQAGIVRVVAEKQYKAAQDTRDFFSQANITLDVKQQELEDYAK